MLVLVSSVHAKGSDMNSRNIFIGAVVVAAVTATTIIIVTTGRNGDSFPDEQFVVMTWNVRG